MAAQPTATTAPSRGLRKDLIVTTLAQVGVAVGGLLLYRLLAREKGAEGMAAYALVKQAVIFLYPAVALGLGTAVPRYVALGRDERGAGERYLAVALGLTGTAVAILSAALLVVPHATAAVLFGDADRTYLVLPLVATLVATLLMEIVVGYYRGRSEFRLVSVARTLSVAAFPVFLLIAFPRRPIGDLISLMAVAVLLTVALLVARPLAQAVRALGPHRVRTAGGTLLDYGRRRVPGEYAAVVLMTVPPLLAAHFASLREVAYLSAGLYVLAVVTIAFQPVGLVFLPLLARLCGEDFEAARRWVGKLAACALHLAIFATPQLLLFADVAVRAWLGSEFESASRVIRITVLPVAMYLFYLVLRSALDAAAVRSYNSRNNLLALGVAAIAVTLALSLHLGDPIVAIAASFALGIACLGALTLGSVHAVYGIGRSEYAFGAAVALSLAAALVALALRLTIVGSEASAPELALVAVAEIALTAGYVAGLLRAGVSWPADLRDRMLGRVG